MKKLYVLVLIIAVILSSSLMLTSCGQSDKGTKTGTTYVALDINPSVELLVDNASGKVICVMASNSDAEVLLYNSVDEIVGEPLDNACEKIAALAVDYSYVEEGQTITLTVSGSLDVEAAVRTAFSKGLGGVAAIVSTADDYITAKELEHVKTQNAGKAGYDDTLTAGKWRLVKAAMLAEPSMTQDSAVALSEEELRAVIDAQKSEINERLNTAYTIAGTLYDAAFTAAYNSALNNAYLAYIIEHPDLNIAADSAAAAGYIAYAFIRDTMIGIKDASAIYAANPVVKSSDLTDILTVLHCTASNKSAFIADMDEYSASSEFTLEEVAAYINALAENQTENQDKLDYAVKVYLNIMDHSAEMSYAYSWDSFYSNFTIAASAFQTLMTSVYSDNSAIFSLIGSAFSAGMNSIITYLSSSVDFDPAAIIAMLETHMAECLAALALTEEELTAINANRAQMASALDEEIGSVRITIENYKAEYEETINSEMNAKIEYRLSLKTQANSSASPSPSNP